MDFQVQSYATKLIDSGGSRTRFGEVDMRNGNGVAKPQLAVKATGVRFQRGRLVVAFADGREVSVPMETYPSLQHATTAQRKDWKLVGPGKAIYWKSLDLDLSVAGILAGLPEVIPQPPAARKKQAA
jgi:hypothetical protein